MRNAPHFKARLQFAFLYAKKRLTAAIDWIASFARKFCLARPMGEPR